MASPEGWAIDAPTAEGAPRADTHHDTAADPLRVPVLAHQRVPGHPRVGAPRVAYQELSEALSSEYRTDAHFTAYSVPELPHRLTNASREAVSPTMVLLVVDIDDPDAHAEKRPASTEWLDDVRARIARLREDHPGFVGYATKGGVRLVARLARPHIIDSDAAKARWAAFYLLALAWLSRVYGLVADPACSDWTRLYRLPHATRDAAQGPERREVYGDFDEIGVVDFAPSPADREELERLALDDVTRCEAAVASGARRSASVPWKTALQQVREAELGEKYHASARRPVRPMVAVPTPVLDEGAASGLVEVLTQALGSLPKGTGSRHTARLAVVGALLQRGVSHDATRSILQRVARALEEDPRAWWREVGPSTIDRLRRREQTLGAGWLEAHVPAAAEAIASIVDGHALRLAGVLAGRSPPHEIPAESAARVVRDELRATRFDREPALAVIRATPGAGKSRGAAEEAVAAALEGHPSAILVPSHEVATSYSKRLADAGIPVSHLKGLTALGGCHIEAQLQQLAGLGYSVGPVLCEGFGYGGANGPRRLPVAKSAGDAPCPHRASCPAHAERKQLSATSATELVVVAPYQLADAALGHLRDRIAETHPGAGARPLVVVDETPEVVTHHPLSVRALIDAWELGAGDGTAGRAKLVSDGEAWRYLLARLLAEGLRHVDGPRPDHPDDLAPRARDELERLVEIALEHGPKTLHDDVRREVGSLDVAAVLAWGAEKAGALREEARERGARVWPPRLSREAHRRLQRDGGKLQDEERAALETLTLVPRVWAAAMRPDGGDLVALRIVPSAHPEKDSPTLLASMLAASIASALNAGVSVALLDATAPLAMLDAVVRAPPSARRTAGGTRIRSVEVSVADGAPVDRQLLYASRATRRHLGLRRGATPNFAAIARLLEPAVAHLVHNLASTVGPAPLVGLITWAPLEHLLERAWAGSGDADLDRALAPLRERGAVVTFGHYGHTRGLDCWRECNALLCFGAPWPDKEAAERTADALGLSEEVDTVYSAACAAELEQAVGRIRAPWRTSPALVVVVANAAPSGWDRRAGVYEVAQGRPTKVDPALVQEVAQETGSASGAARALGVSSTTAQRCVRAATRTVTGFVRPRFAAPHEALEEAEERRAIQWEAGLEAHPHTGPPATP